MRLELSPEFKEESARYNLRFCCEDCGNWDELEACCAHGWPSEEHRARYYDDPGCRALVFCKEFELR